MPLVVKTLHHLTPQKFSIHQFARKSFLSFGFFLITKLALCQTSITNDITINTTWGLVNSPYSIDQFGGIQVATGVTLTIEPGVMVTFAGSNHDLTINGTLIADGGPGADTIRFQNNLSSVFLGSSSTGSIVDHVRFTALGASNVAAINVSSDATITNSKFAFCEVGVTVLNGASPVIQDCEMASSNDYGIRVDDGTPSITNVRIDGNGLTNSAGIWIQGGSPTISNSTFEDTGGNGAIWIDHTVAPVLNNNTFSNNVRDLTTHPMLLDDTHYDNNGLSVIYVDPRNITGNTTWQSPQAPESWVYEMVFGDITVEAGNTLTIEPGVEVVYINNSQDLFVDGILDASGTVADSVILKDGAATIELRAGSGPHTLDYVRMEGMGAFNTAGLLVSTSNATISNSRFVNDEIGITVLAGTSPVIQSCEFFACGDYGIRVDDGSPTITNVNIDGNNVANSAGIWIQNGSPSITSSTFQNIVGVAGIWVNTSTASIIDNNTFTNNTADILAHPMILDDQNFDNNGLSTIHIDNETITGNTTWHEPVLPEDWKYVTTGALSVDAGAVLAIEPGVEVEFANAAHDLTINGTLSATGTASYPIRFTGGNATIFLSTSSNGTNLDYVKMEQMGTANIAGLAVSSDATISNSLFDQCEVGISVDNSASPTVQNSVIKNSNDYGMLVSSGSPSVNNSAIYDNPTGINNTGAGTVDATSNWWGDVSGPTHSSNPTGTGDAVSDNVTFIAFLLENPVEPVAPLDLFTTEVSETQIDLSWTDNSAIETGFIIERSDGNRSNYSVIGTVGADVESFSDNTVTAGNGYFYRVHATNGAIMISEYSNEKFGGTISSPGNALQFDGIDDNISFSVPFQTTFSDFTIEFWAKIPVTNDGQIDYLTQRDPAGGGTPQIVIAATFNNTMYMFLRETNGGTTSLAQGTTLLNDDTWHHLTYVREGTELRVYVDGVLDGTATSFGGDITFPATAVANLEGDAVLDEFRLWNLALDEATIGATSLNTLAGNEANLVSYYRFDQDEITDFTLPDRSTSHNHGTWSGTSGVATPQWVISDVPIPRPVVSVYQGPDISGMEIFDLQAIPVNFGNTPLATTKPLTFTIENTGSEDLVISDITTSGDFSVTSSTSFTVTTGSSATFTVESLALAQGIANGNVTIQSNDPDFVFPVTGTKGTLFPKAYWTDETGTQDDEIDRVDFTGANGQNAYYSGFSIDIRGIAVDTHNNMVFWTNTDSEIKCGRIGAAGFTGTNTVLDESGSGTQEFTGIDVDGAAGKIYWCDVFNGQIRRVNFDGSDPEVLVTKAAARDIALDVAGGKIYYLANDGGVPEIWRANLNGSSAENLITSGTTVFRGLALDLLNNHIYWTENGTISRSNLDGTGQEVVSTQLAEPESIDLDIFNEMIYVLDGANNSVVRLTYQDDPLEIVESVLITDPQFLAIDTRTMAPLNVVSTTPTSNGSGVSLDASVTITFDESVDPFTVRGSNILVTGDQSGRIAGSFSGGGTTMITFDPTSDFKAGEIIRVSVTKALKGIGGGDLVNDHYFEFVTVGAPASDDPPLLEVADIYNVFTNTGVDRVVAIDVNMDGAMDVTAIYEGIEDGIVWYQNDGSQQFTREIAASPSFGDSQSVAAADLDLDGDIDLLSAYAGILNWYENDGAFNFTEIQINLSGFGHGLADIRVVDLDGDGDLDIVGIYGSNVAGVHRIVWNENDGNQAFTRHLFEANIILPLALEIADVDADGDIDILAGGANGEFAWYENDGDQSFTPHTFTSSLSSQFSGFAVGDFDGDGHIDMAMNTTTETTWFVNDGSGSFTESVISATTGGSDLQAADLDGDSDMDLISGSGGSLRFFENDGSGNFTIQTSSTSANIEDIFVTDLDSDGDLDVVAGCQGARVIWFENVVSTNQPPSLFYIFSVAEESEAGTLIGTILATDPENDPLTYSIISGNTNNAFAVNSTSGDITVNSSTALDFENTPTFNLTVQADDGNGGISMADVTINLTDIDENALGINDLENKINVYPNPVTDRLVIELDSGLSGDFQILMFTVSGREVLTESDIRRNGNEMELNVEHLNPGIYLLKIVNENKVAIKNILVR